MRIKLLGISLSFAILTLFFTITAMARIGDVSQLHETYNTKTVDYASTHSRFMDFVGHVGGTAQALDKQGERLYVGIGSRLHIIDVSNPATPIILGKTDVFLGQISKVQVSGNYGYIVVERSNRERPKLHIYNIANPLYPVEVADIANVSEFVLEENLLYVLAGSLKIFDVTNPNQPLEIGSYAQQLGDASMAVDDNYVYLASGPLYDCRLWIFDVTDFNNIGYVTFLQLDAGCKDVIVRGDYVYIANGHSGLTRIDVSTPATPAEVDWGGEENIAYALDATDTRLYATGGSLRVYNIENSTPPTNVGIYEPDDFDDLSADIVVDGAYAYIANGAGGVHIVDIADVARAYRVGALTDPGDTNSGRNIYVAGDYAYVPDATPVVSSNLRIVDVADPANPVDLGNHYQFKCVHDVVVQGTTAYLAGCDKIYAADVTDPAHPHELGIIDAVNEAKGIDVSGDYIFVAQKYFGYFGLRIIDVSDPTNLQEAGSLTISGEVYDVIVVGDIAYISSNVGLYIVDVTIPHNPVELNLITEATGSLLVVTNNFVYAWSWPNELNIFDVTNPYNPSLISTSIHPDVSSIIDLDIENGTLLLSNYHYQTYMIDVSDPMSPYLLDTYNSRSTPGSIDIQGDYAYVYQWDNKMDILDVGDLKIPHGIGHLATPIDGREVGVIGDFAYVVDGDGTPHVIDVTDPAAPAVISKTSPIPSVRDMVISGTYLFVAGGSLHIFDVTDLNDPQPLVAHFREGDEMVIKDNLAYMGGGGSLDIIDIADPHNPNLLGYTQLFRSAEDMTLSGNYIYIADDNGLQIVDVTTPTSPSRVDRVHSTSGYDFIVARGNYLYISQGVAVYVFDISDPENPVEVNHIYTSAFFGIHGMELSGHLIYVTANEGVFIVDISNPENPVEVDFFETPGQGWDLTVQDGLIYVADGAGGLTILSVFEPVSAIIPPTGGTLSSAIDGTSYIFPAGSFTDTVIVTHNYRFPESVLAPPVDLIGINHFFEITAVYSSTNQPAELAPGAIYTVTVQYDDTDVGAAIEDTLLLYYQGDEEWQDDFVASDLDIDTNQLVTTLDHFSIWGVMGETNRIFLPIVAKNW